MKSGDLIAQKYELVVRVGVGGMGSVWRVAHLSTGRDFAIKFLHPAVATSEDSRQRFLQEAKASARINHPNIIDIFDVGETEDGALFLVMELLDGISLGEALRSEPPFNARELLLVLAEVCTALIAAHAVGVIHRDVKPPNIFLHRDRGTGFVSAKVLDFGVSKVLSGDDGVSTHTGSLLGSPRYMSPEQAHSAASADGRSDVWSMGVVLFEALTGRFPHDRDSSNSLVVAIATKPPKPIHSVAPHLPLALRLLVEDCLKPLDQRIDSAGLLLDRLLSVLATHDDLDTIPLARPTIAKGKPRMRPESFILRSSAESIPGLATSMLRASRSGAANDARVRPQRPAPDSPAYAEAPRNDEATTVEPLFDPSTNTFTGAELEEVLDESSTQLPTTVQRPVVATPLPFPPPLPAPIAPKPHDLGAPQHDRTVRIDELRAAEVMAAPQAAAPPPRVDPAMRGTWRMGVQEPHRDVVSEAPVTAGASGDPTLESISSINVARGADIGAQLRSAQLSAPFSSGPTKQRRARIAVVVAVGALISASAIIAAFGYSRGDAPADPSAKPAAGRPENAPTTTSIPASDAPRSTAAPASASGPVMVLGVPSASASASATPSNKPVARGGTGRLPAKPPDDPVKKLGSGLGP